MKTLIVLETWDPQKDGVIQFVKQYTKRYPATVFTTGHGAQASRMIKVAGYPAPRVTLRYLRSLARKVREHDVVFLQGYPGVNSTIALLMCKWYNKPAAVYAHVNIEEFIHTFLRIPKICATFLTSISVKLLQKRTGCSHRTLTTQNYTRDSPSRRWALILTGFLTSIKVKIQTCSRLGTVGVLARKKMCNCYVT